VPPTSRRVAAALAPAPGSSRVGSAHSPAHAAALLPSGVADAGSPRSASASAACSNWGAWAGLEAPAGVGPAGEPGLGSPAGSARASRVLPGGSARPGSVPPPPPPLPLPLPLPLAKVPYCQHPSAGLDSSQAAKVVPGWALWLPSGITTLRWLGASARAAAGLCAPGPGATRPTCRPGASSSGWSRGALRPAWRG
jgi:hypothetical protein